MTRCRACEKELSQTSRFCPSCGAPVTRNDPDELETIAMPAVRPSPSSGRTAAVWLFNSSASPPAP
ncbi:MAG: zinc-ribbon domain-containing protein [Bryobacterales bacterium]|nr:zinc-ribbon domain-containing protein [Bryobacterales bacterium]